MTSDVPATFEALRALLDDAYPPDLVVTLRGDMGCLRFYAWNVERTSLLVDNWALSELLVDGTTLFVAYRHSIESIQAVYDDDAEPPYDDDAAPPPAVVRRRHRSVG